MDNLEMALQEVRSYQSGLQHQNMIFPRVLCTTILPTMTSKQNLVQHQGWISEMDYRNVSYRVRPVTPTGMFNGKDREQRVTPLLLFQAGKDWWHAFLRRQSSSTTRYKECLLFNLQWTWPNYYIGMYQCHRQYNFSHACIPRDQIFLQSHVGLCRWCVFWKVCKWVDDPRIILWVV